MLRKLIKWIVGLAILLALVVFIVLPLVASTEQGRKQLAKLMSKALGREVTIGDLDVGLFLSSIDIENLRIANPEGFPEGDMISADSLSMDASLRKLIGGTLKSGLTGSGLKLHVIKKGGKTNLDGFAKKREADPKKSGDSPDLDLSVDLKDGQLVIEDMDKGETIVVEGVSTKMRLTNTGGVQGAGLTITVASVDNKTLRIRDLVLDTRLDGDYLQVTELSALMPGKGTLGGTGQVRVRDGDDWTFDLDMKTVGIDGDMVPFVAAVFPLASAAGGQIDGTMDGTFKLNGHGLTWDKVKPNLAGSGKITLTDLELPTQSAAVLLAKLAGSSSESIRFNNAGAVFDIKNGWIEFHRLSASGKQVRYDLEGKVSMQGQLALSIDLLPLVKLFGGGETYKSAAKYVNKLPVGIGGTTSKPKLKAPKLRDLAKGAIGGILDGLGKK